MSYMNSYSAVQLQACVINGNVMSQSSIQLW